MTRRRTFARAATLSCTQRKSATAAALALCARIRNDRAGRRVRPDRRHIAWLVSAHGQSPPGSVGIEAIEALIREWLNR